MPAAGRLAGVARADGGDFIWLDEQTMLAGRSYRTNAAALAEVSLKGDGGPTCLTAPVLRAD